MRAVRQQWKQLDELNHPIGRHFTVLKGIECTILETGGMELPVADMLAWLDDLELPNSPDSRAYVVATVGTATVAVSALSARIQ
jgi:hypothetical protein